MINVGTLSSSIIFFLIYECQHSSINIDLKMLVLTVVIASYLKSTVRLIIKISK